MAVSSIHTAGPGLAPPPPPPGPPAWRRPARVGALALAGTAALAVVNPSTTHVPLCPLKALTGIDCPACGSLRAVHALTRLDVPAAFDHNALFTVLVPFLIVGWAVWLSRSLGRPVLGQWRYPDWAGPALLAAGLVFAVARNLAPFAYFASS